MNTLLLDKIVKQVKSQGSLGVYKLCIYDHPCLHVNLGNVRKRQAYNI